MAHVALICAIAWSRNGNPLALDSHTGVWPVYYQKESPPVVFHVPGHISALADKPPTATRTTARARLASEPPCSSEHNPYYIESLGDIPALGRPCGHDSSRRPGWSQDTIQWYAYAGIGAQKFLAKGDGEVT